MKNYYQKVIIIAGVLIAAISLWAVKVNASDIISGDFEVIYNAIIDNNDHLTGKEVEKKTPETKEVRIYNSEDNLIRVAKEGSILLQPVLNKADFLLEVDNVKYYRINK